MARSKSAILSSGSRLSRICHQFGWDQHGVRPRIHNSGLAVQGINSGCASASWLCKLPQEIYSEIHEGDGAQIKLAINTGLTGVEMDSGCRNHISNAEKGIYRNTDSPAFQPAKTNHSADRGKRLRKCRHPQLVQRIRDSLASQFLLSKMHLCRTELWQVRSGAPGDCWSNDTMERLSPGR